MIATQITGWSWEHEDFDRLCPRISRDTGASALASHEGAVALGMQSEAAAAAWQAAHVTRRGSAYYKL